MVQVMASPFLEEARRACTRRRCGLCRVYPGNGEVCEERGRAVSPLSRPCRVYDGMTAEEFAEVKEKKKAYCLEHKEEMAEKQKAYCLEHKEELAEKQRVLKLLQTADPELYEQLLKEAQR